MTTAPAETTRPSRTRVWARRLLRVALVVVLLLLAVRLAVPFVLPSVLDSLVADAGLSLRYENLELSLLRGDVQIWNAELSRRRDDGAEPTGDDRVAHLDYLHVNLDLTSLLSGPPHLRRVSVDGLDLWAETDAQGNLALPLGAQPGTAETPVVEEEAASGQVTFDLPVLLGSARLQHLRLHARDPAHDVERWVEASLRLSSIGTGEGPARLQLQVYGPELVDSLAIEGRATLRADRIDANVELSIQGLRPENAATWLRPLGLEPRAGVLTAALHADLRAIASTTPGRVDLDAELTGVQVNADGTEQVAVDRVRVDAQLGEATTLSDVSIEGVRGRATLRADGALNVFGLDLVGVTPDEEGAAEGGPGEGAADPPVPELAAGEAGALRIQALSLSGLDLNLSDEGATPPVDLQLLAEHVAFRDLDTGPDAQPATLSFRGSAPGIAETLTLDGEANPFRQVAHADLVLRASGVTLERLTPYLQAMQLQPTLQDGQLQLRFRARTEAGDPGSRASATLEGLRLVDGEPLLEIDRIELGELLAQPARTRLDGVEIEGVRVAARRGGDGAIHLLGFRTIQTEMLARVGQVAQVLEPVPEVDAALGRLELGSLHADGMALHLRDELLGGEFSLENLEMDLRDLAFGGPEDPDAEADEGQIEVRLRGAFAESVSLSGSLSTTPGVPSIAADLLLQGDGVDLAPLAPYLADAGIEPVFTGGKFGATLRGEAGLGADGNLELDVSVADLSVSRADGTQVFALGELSVESAAIGADGLHVGEVTLTAPEILAVQQADGRLRVAGLILNPTASESGPGDDVPRAATPAPTTSVSTDKLAITGALLRWRDETRTPALDAGFTLDASVEGLTTGVGAAATPISLTFGRPADDARASIDGEVTLDPDNLRAQLALDARGLRPGPLVPYVPAGVTMTMQDGRLRADLEAGLSHNPEGGQAVELVASNVSLQDGESGPVLLSWGTARLHVPRWDGAGQVYEIGEVAVRGLQLTAARTSTTAISLLGLTIDSAADEVGTRVAVPPPPTADAAVGPPPTEDQEEEAPRLALGNLDIELERLTWHELNSAEPLQLSLRLTNESAVVLSDPDPKNLKAGRLRLEGAATPLIEKVSVEWEAFPQQQEARLDATWELSGIRGGMLPRVLPALAESLSADGIQEGRFVGNLSAFTELRQQAFTDFDAAMGIGLQLQVQNVSVVATPDGEPLAGIDEILLDAPRVTTAAATISSLDISGVHGRIRRDEEGLHVAGLMFKPSPPGDSGAGRMPVQPSGDRFDVSIGRLTASARDLEFHNATLSPELVLPLANIEMELDDFSTRAFRERDSFRFSLALEGGPIPVPMRSDSGLIRGIFSAAGDMIGTTGNVETQQRPLLEELSINGELAMYPHPSGRVRASLTGLELVALRGPAGSAGVKISDGVVDARADLRFAGEDGVYTDATVTFGHLSLEESADGPISTYLRLPAPTNTVIFLLKDDQDEIVIPLSFHVAEGRIRGGAITREAINAFRSVVTDAVASSPYRVTGAVTNTVSDTLTSIGSLFGLGGSSEPAPPAPPIRVEFAPGDPSLSEAARTGLDEIATVLRGEPEITAVLRHEFGLGDAERARLLANPSPEQTLEVVTLLRQRRAEIARRRSELSAIARAQHAVGQVEEAARTTTRLQDLDRDLGETEDSLDQALELLRPNADRRADRRTLDTALSIGNARLAGVKQYLLEVLGPRYEDRVEIRSARKRVVQPEEGGPDQPLGRVTVTPRRRAR